LLDSVNKINSRGPACAPSPTATSTTEEQEKIYTDFLWKFNEMAGVSTRADWTWLRLVSMDHELKTPLHGMIVDMFKDSGREFDERVSAEPMGKCTLRMSYDVQLNSDKDQLILGKISRISITKPNPTCGCGQNPNCENIEGICYQIISMNESETPLTESTITPDFLKPLRDKRTEIDRLCKDNSK